MWWLDQYSVERPYATYASNHPIAHDTLGQCLREPKTTAFAGFVKDVEKKPALKHEPLSSFLILPIQRLCKYPLLLKNLLDATPPDDPDYQKLAVALDRIGALVLDVNERKATFDSRAKIVELQERVLALDRFKLERFLLEGIFVELGRDGEHVGAGVSIPGVASGGAASNSSSSHGDAAAALALSGNTSAAAAAAAAAGGGAAATATATLWLLFSNVLVKCKPTNRGFKAKVPYSTVSLWCEEIDHRLQPSDSDLSTYVCLYVPPFLFTHTVLINCDWQPWPRIVWCCWWARLGEPTAAASSSCAASRSTRSGSGSRALPSCATSYKSSTATPPFATCSFRPPPTATSATPSSCSPSTATCGIAPTVAKASPCCTCSPSS